MKKLINLLLGYALWQITGPFPERMLNLCARHRLPFWRMCRTDGASFTFRTPLYVKKQVTALAAQAGCQATLLSVGGLGAALPRLGRRWGFPVGLALCLFAAGFLSRFLLTVEVVGCESVSPAVILTELARLGVRPGAYGPFIDKRAIANEALLSLPQLSYMIVNINGTRAEIIVEEVIRPPELLDEQTPTNIVACADGIVVDIRADSGRALVREGDIVAAGDVLIAGALDLQEPPYSQTDLGWLVVHASGSVRARTWRTLEESIPLTAAEKTYTGREQTFYTLNFLWNEIEFFKNSSISYDRYDKITSTRMLTAAGREMPLGLTSVTVREYTVAPAPLDVEAAEQRLTQILRARLTALMDANEGRVLRTDPVTRLSDGMLTVTLLAECEEEIGRIETLPGEVGRIPGSQK